jgi:hypothetical protein
VLQFVASLTDSPQKGERGAALRPFSSSLDPAAARQMAQAIEDECERVDANDW